MRKKRTRPAFSNLDESNATDVRVAARAGDNITRAQAKVVEGQFPDCDSVLPAPSREGNLYDPARHGAAAFTHTRIGVNAKQFAETMQVVSDLAADDTNNTVVMTVPVDPNRPIRLDARCPGRRAAAVVMSVSADFPAYDELAEPEQSATAAPAVRSLPAPASPPAQVSGGLVKARTRTRRWKKPPVEFAGASANPAVEPSTPVNAGARW